MPTAASNGRQETTQSFQVKPHSLIEEGQCLRSLETQVVTEAIPRTCLYSFGSTAYVLDVVHSSSYRAVRKRKDMQAIEKAREMKLI